MSSAKKAKRLIKEVKQALAHRVYANKFSIQNEMIPAILQEIMTYFKKSSTESM
jgi:ribosomal protein L31E